MDSTNPDTRARTSTVFTATKRPVYSSHSVIFCCTGFETVTAGSCGAFAAGLLSQPAKVSAVNRTAHNGNRRIIGCSPIPDGKLCKGKCTEQATASEHYENDI